MEIEEALHNFIRELTTEYGVKDPIIKIALSHEAFDAVMLAACKSDLYKYSYRPSNCNDFRIFDVPIVARRKDEF